MPSKAKSRRVASIWLLEADEGEEADEEVELDREERLDEMLDSELETELVNLSVELVD